LIVTIGLYKYCKVLTIKSIILRMSVELFKQYCKENGIDIEVLNEGSTTRTAKDSAETHGVELNRIVKSLLVKIGDEFVIFLVPGDKRLDFKYLEERFGTKDIRMANADEVKDVTGYSIGGVPPFGHKAKLKTYIEDGFPKEGELLVAAGREDSVFRVSLDELGKYIEVEP
jgi:Cys-tRNA(Pro) deacylase